MSRLELFYAVVTSCHLGNCLSLPIRFRCAMTFIQSLLGHSHSVMAWWSTTDVIRRQSQSLPHEETFDHQGVLDVTQLCSNLDEVAARWAPSTSCEHSKLQTGKDNNQVLRWKTRSGISICWIYWSIYWSIYWFIHPSIHNHLYTNKHIHHLNIMTYCIYVHIVEARSELLSLC